VLTVGEQMIIPHLHQLESTFHDVDSIGSLTYTVDHKTVIESEKPQWISSYSNNNGLGWQHHVKCY